MPALLRFFIRRSLRLREWLFFLFEPLMGGRPRSHEALDPTRIAILAPFPPGNLGDEAMVTGTIAGLLGRTRPPTAIDVIFVGSPNRTLDHPRLTGVTIRCWSIPRVRLFGLSTRKALAARLAGAGELFVVGADAIDGSYNPRMIAIALKTCAWASADGRPVTVLGFSFHHGDPRIAKRLAALPPAVRLCVRDELSASRLTAATGKTGSPVADVAFLMPPAPGPAVDQLLRRINDVRSTGGLAIGLNLNPQRLARFPEILDTLLGLQELSGRRVLFVGIGHDGRHGIDDWSAFRGRQMEICPKEVRAWEVKALAGHLDLVITGRMHLAIAAFGAGTPAIGLHYMGKFQGLFRLLGLPDAALIPADEASSALVKAALEGCIRDLAGMKEALVRALPTVMELSGRNTAKATG